MPTDERALLTSITEVQQPWEFAVGDYVTRSGSDVQLVKDMTEDGFSATFVCVVAPTSGWCAVGDEECNLCRRYSNTGYTPDAPPVLSSANGEGCA